MSNPAHTETHPALRVAPSAVEETDAVTAAEVLLSDEALYEVWLNAGWRWLTARMRTPVKEAFADAVDRHSAVLAADDDEPLVLVERWWRDSSGDVRAPGDGK